MRPLLALLCLIILLTEARAQCIPWPYLGIWPAPEQATIQPRQRFQFSAGSGGSTFTALKHVGRDFVPYLRSAHDSVALLVIDTLTDRTGDYSVLLRPERPLQADSSYQLSFRLDSASADMLRPGISGRVFRPKSYRWRVASVADNEAPRWQQTPQVVDYAYSYNSEGEEFYTRFTSTLRDASPCLLRATVRPVGGGVVQRAFIPPDTDFLRSGAFTCYEPFRLLPGTEYMVTFEATDANGNRATCSPIRFPAPPRIQTPHR